MCSICWKSLVCSFKLFMFHIFASNLLDNSAWEPCTDHTIHSQFPHTGRYLEMIQSGWSLWFRRLLIIKKHCLRFPHIQKHWKVDIIFQKNFKVELLPLVPASDWTRAKTRHETWEQCSIDLLCVCSPKRINRGYFDQYSRLQMIGLFWYSKMDVQNCASRVFLASHLDLCSCSCSWFIVHGVDHQSIYVKSILWPHISRKWQDVVESRFLGN